MHYGIDIESSRRFDSVAIAIIVCALLVILLVVSVGGGPVGFSQSEVPIDPVSLIREEQKVILDGVTETWRLEWQTPPKPVCDLDEPRLNLTCPCVGFAFGEGGRLDLVRLVNKVEIDRLRLTPLFQYQGQAVVQRWSVEDMDIEEADTDGFGERVRARPTVTLMRFADYDHDGQATEFFLQTEVEPCGKRTGVVIGVSHKNPRLHAFTTLLHPEKPLVMHQQEWEALLGISGPVQVPYWKCGDHAVDTETITELSVEDESIRAVRRVYDCKRDGKPGPMLREYDL